MQEFDPLLFRQEFDSDNPPEAITDERYLNDVNCIASLCKMYFRELPDPLLTFQLYDQFAVSFFPGTFGFIEELLNTILGLDKSW